MESKNFSAMNFEEQITLLYDLADGWNILHAKLVFKTILNAIKAVGYSYTYQKDLAIKTLKSMLNDVEEKYGIESAQYREIAILYHIILKG
jgi:hypothetical protein